MNHAILIFRKEARRYFTSPAGIAPLMVSGLLFAPGVAPDDPKLLLGPVALLSNFKPSSDFLRHPRITLLVGLARIVILFLIPTITMQLFVEERRSRTIVARRVGRVPMGRSGLPSRGGGLLCVDRARRQPPCRGGMHIHMHQARSRGGCGHAAGVHGGFEMVRYGLPAPLDMGLCVALMAIGWTLTWRSIQTLRGTG